MSKEKKPGPLGHKMPVLDDMPPHTPLEAEFARKYTRISACAVRGEPEAHVVWLEIEQQSFIIGNVPLETAHEASFLCLMLAKALVKITFRELCSMADDWAKNRRSRT